MPAPYSAGSIFLQVVPSFRGVPEQIAREARDWPDKFSRDFDERMDKVARETGKKMGKSISEEIGKAGADGGKRFSDEFERNTTAKKLFQKVESESGKSGERAGQEYGGRFATSVRNAVQRVNREVGTLKFDVDDKAAQAKLRQLKRDLQALSGEADIGIDLDVGTVMLKLQAVEEALREMQDSAATIDMRVNSASALGEVSRVRAELMALSTIQIEPEVKIDRQMGAFERGLKGAIDNALRDLGTVNVGVGSNAAERAIADLRRQLFELADRRIGVDVSADTARERLAQIRDELEKLQREHWSVDIDANTAAAFANLNNFLAALEAVDGHHVDVDIDVHDAVSAITQLRALETQSDHTRRALHGVNRMGDEGANSFRAFNALMLGVAALGPLVVPALGAVAGGIAALIPLAAAGGVAIGALALGLWGIGDAFKALGDYQDNAAKDAQTYEASVRNAANGVQNAERAVADAREQAAQSAEQAARRVEDAQRGVADAERGLSDAQRDAEEAQRDLTRAREQAAEQLEDLQLRIRGGELDERQAALDLREAEAALAKARSEGVAGDELEAYIIRLERARLRVDQTRESNADLTKEAQKWAQTGIEGSDVVVAAQKRVEDSQRRIADAERGLADAQRAVSDARAEQARSAADSQKAIQAAQQRLTEAQLDYQDALNKTSSSADKVNETMMKLGPSGREFVRFLDGLRPRMQGLRAIAQEGLLPGLTDWIETTVNYHGPLLEHALGGISKAVGDMFSNFAQSMRGPEFTALFQMIDRSGPQFIGYMSQVLRNLGEGVASLTVAIEPLGHIFGQDLVDMSERFARWAASLQGSTGLQHFFDYLADILPRVGKFIWNFVDALIQIGVAISPYAGWVLDFFTGLLGWIAGMDPSVLGPIVSFIFAMVAGLQLIFAASSSIFSISAAWTLMGRAVQFLGGGVLLLAGAVAAMIAAWVLLYQRSEAVRDVLGAIGRALEATIGWFMNLVFGTGREVSKWLDELIILVGLVATAFVGWKIITGIIAMIAGLRSAIALLGFTSATASGQMLGLQTNVANSGKALSGKAAALTGVTIALSLYFMALQKVNNEQAKWTDALLKGGAAARQAQQEMANPSFWDKFLYNLTHWGNTSKVASRQAEDVNRALRDQWNAMSPLEQAQAKVTEWTNTLADRQEHLGETSRDTQIAHERLAYWTQVVEERQRRLDDATTGVNKALLEQQNRAIALTQADMAYAQSTEQLAQAHQRVADALKENGADSREYKDALAALESQSMATADAAGRVAAARHQDANAAEKQQWTNAAILADLQKQKEEYGNLPPRLEALRAELEKTVPVQYQIMTGFENLGLAVKSVPDNKSIIVESTTQEQRDLLAKLGFEVQQLPDGTFKVTALTDEARAAIEELLKPKTLLITTMVVDSSSGTYQDTWKTPEGGSRTGPRYNAEGGFIRGPGTWTSDSILSWLSNGEYVVRAASVAKFGVSFFDALNEGTYPEYARGGRVRRKGGLPAFADGGAVGGYSADWGGTISLSGGNVNPLARMWFDALTQISMASGAARNFIAGTFAGMRDDVLGIFTQTRDGSNNLFTQLRDLLFGRTSETRDNTNNIFTQLRDLVFGRSTETRDGTNSIWTNLRDLLFGRSSEARDQQVSIFSQIRDTLIQAALQTVSGMLQHWAPLPVHLMNPVNKIIDAVLNNGLFKAFNAIVGALGLDAKLNIPTVDQVKLAAGGKVPGWSPHDKADNIPAWLTAGEWVQPVDAVQYYGPEFMEAIRKKRLPREIARSAYADGGWVHPTNAQRLALGGRPTPSSVDYSNWAPHVQLAIKEIVEKFGFSGTIGTYSGHQPTMALAADFMVPLSSALGSALADFAYQNQARLGLDYEIWMQRIREMNPAGGWVGMEDRGSLTQNHYDHVHLSWLGTPGDPNAPLTLLGDILGIGLDLASDPIGYLKKIVNDALGDFDADGVPVKKMMAEGVRSLTGHVGQKLVELIASIMPTGGESPFVPATGDIVEQVRAVAAKYGWGSGPEWDAIDWIIQRESSWNPNAANPSSSARGLFQKMTDIHGPLEPTVAGQAEWGMNYIKGRYGHPLAAKAFWLANGWYGTGGPVQDRDGNGAIIPDLHDTGGWIMPGLNVLMNRTNRPEPVINPQTLDALIAIGERGGAGAAIGSLTIPVMNGPSAAEIAGEIMHEVTVAKRGGKY